MLTLLYFWLGGAKIWECTETLVEFLIKKTENGSLIDDFHNSRILDLGCGSGLLGVLALQNNAVVHFQDYVSSNPIDLPSSKPVSSSYFHIHFQNKSVLKHITIPNVIANVETTSALNEKCRFYSGDWANYVVETKDDEKFDFILTSETIYNVLNYDKIINLLKTKLKPNGICYLAAKQQYFGVGGSIGLFKNALSNYKIFKSECVYTCNENVSREILKITLTE